jgi:hypothetical protein
MDSDAMIYLPGFIKFDSRIQKLIGRIHSHADSMEMSLAYIYFFEIRKIN